MKDFLCVSWYWNEPPQRLLVNSYRSSILYWFVRYEYETQDLCVYYFHSKALTIINLLLLTIRVKRFVDEQQRDGKIYHVFFTLAKNLHCYSEDETNCFLQSSNLLQNNLVYKLVRLFPRQHFCTKGFIIRSKDLGTFLS